MCPHCTSTDYSNGSCFDCGMVFEILPVQEQMALELQAITALLTAQQALTDTLLETSEFILTISSQGCEDTLISMLNEKSFELKLIDLMQNRGF